MQIASRLSLPLVLLAALPAQRGETPPARPASPVAVPAVASPQDPVVVTQQEQNQLRATAFKAENEGRYGVAADAFLKLSNSAPARQDWIIAAGRCLGRSGRFAAAIDLLDAGRKRFDGDIEISAMLARTLLLQTESAADMMNPEIIWADAAEIAEGVLKAYPDHEDCRLLLAQARYLMGNWDEAVRQAQEAVTRHPQRPGAHVLLGRIATDRFRRLLKDYQESDATGQEQSDLVGKLHAERVRAKQAFMQAAKLDPTRAHPHVALSQLASIDGNLDEAKAHLRDALAIDPDVAVDHDMLTADMNAQQRLAFYQGIREQFTKATTLPKAPRAKRTATLLFHEGRAQLDGLQFAAARTSFRLAIAGDPSAKNAHYYCFLAAYYLKDYDDAEQHAAIYARAGAPAFADVLRAVSAIDRVQIAEMVLYLGNRAYEEQRIENSRDLNHVIACLKDSADAWNNHAYLCRETEQFESAYSSYQHAIEKEPTSAQLWNDAAVVLQYHLPTRNNLTKARTMYETALQLATTSLADKSISAQQRTFAEEAQVNARANIAALDKLSKGK
ncbi:MAG: tetratricopeptide (TPR) repeat protein [Planctomycetota bacterium]|jgi:tetratricopeptide (TPR) repeat protein